MSSSDPEPPPAASAPSSVSAASVATAGSPTDATRAVAWALGLGVLATGGLAALAWALLVMHAIGYGGFLLLSPESHVAPPEEHRYVLALATGAATTIVGGPVLAWLAARGLGRTWGAALVGLGAGVLAAVAGASALLLVLGIDPVAFVLGT